MPVIAKTKTDIDVTDDDIIKENENIEIVESEEDKLKYKDSTFEIVSKIAYLIGVPKKVFENENQSPKLDIYKVLDQNKNARIIRHLCALRTALQRSYKHVNLRMKFENRSFLTMSNFIPKDSIRQLDEDGVPFFKSRNERVSQHIVELNRLISDRINNCKTIFPLWIKWEYIKHLFVMPNGLAEEGTKTAATLYYENMDSYPYKMYINWKPREYGNILYSDKKFVTLLYQQNGDEFLDFSKVSDVGHFVKGGIYDFIEEGEKIAVVVDCENSDPYKVCATFRNLDESYTEKISTILLFDDVHTASTWSILEQYTDIHVEHVMTERVKGNKSLVDIMLAVRTAKEHYDNQVDSFLLVSSDSDFWGLISSIPTAKFLVMVERDAVSPLLKSRFTKAGIFYCYIDDFYSGNTEDLKKGALIREMYRYIDKNVNLNINDMFEQALISTRIDMPESEKKQFIAQHVKTMQMSIDPDGDLILSFKN